MSEGIFRRDDDILDFIFNPTGVPFASAPKPDSPSNGRVFLRSHWIISQLEPDEAVIMKEYPDAQKREARKLEIEAVKLAESNEYDKALDLFAQALEYTPKNPSILNNR